MLISEDGFSILVFWFPLEYCVHKMGAMESCMIRYEKHDGNLEE